MLNVGWSTLLVVVVRFDNLYAEAEFRFTFSIFRMVDRPIKKVVFVTTHLFNLMSS